MAAPHQKRAQQPAVELDQGLVRVDGQREVDAAVSVDAGHSDAALGQGDGELVHLHVGGACQHEHTGLGIAVALVDHAEAVHLFLEVQALGRRAEEVVLTLEQQWSGSLGRGTWHPSVSRPAQSSFLLRKLCPACAYSAAYCANAGSSISPRRSCAASSSRDIGITSLPTRRITHSGDAPAVVSGSRNAMSRRPSELYSDWALKFGLWTSRVPRTR